MGHDVSILREFRIRDFQILRALLDQILKVFAIGIQLFLYLLALGNVTDGFNGTRKNTVVVIQRTRYSPQSMRLPFYRQVRLCEESILLSRNKMVLIRNLLIRCINQIN